MGKNKQIDRENIKVSLDIPVYERIKKLGKLTHGGMSRMVEDSLRAYLPIFEMIYGEEPETAYEKANQLALLFMHPEILGRAFARCLEEGAKDLGKSID